MFDISPHAAEGSLKDTKTLSPEYLSVIPGITKGVRNIDSIWCESVRS